MNTLRHPDDLNSHRLLSVVAHPDDLEMHHSAVLSYASESFAFVATDGEGTTLNFTNQALDTPEAIARIRRSESELSLGKLGLSAVVYGGLPDGELAYKDHFADLVGQVQRTIREYDITAVASLGEEGYCGHLDHKAVHYATMAVKYALQGEGMALPVLTLAHDHLGELRVPVRRSQKLAAVARHATQFKNDGQGGIDPEFWREHRAPVYGPLLERETFAVLV